MYIIVNKETLALHHSRSRKVRWSRKGDATKELNRSEKADTHKIMMAEDYEEPMVERINLMSGKPYMEGINTPACCSPSCETYWSM
tara:strand:+ start:8459 stop:8716 length:258 start_codon:yes stop_codon:yes gene_type:complete